MDRDHSCYAKRKASLGLLRALPSSERHCVWLFSAHCSKLLRFDFNRYVGGIPRGFVRSATSVWLEWQLSGREWYLWSKAACSSDGCLISQWRSPWRKSACRVSLSFCAGEQSGFSDQGTTFRNRISWNQPCHWDHGSNSNWGTQMFPGSATGRSCISVIESRLPRGLFQAFNDATLWHNSTLWRFPCHNDRRTSHAIAP